MRSVKHVVILIVFSRESCKYANKSETVITIWITTPVQFWKSDKSRQIICCSDVFRINFMYKTHNIVRVYYKNNLERRWYPILFYGTTALITKQMLYFYKLIHKDNMSSTCLMKSLQCHRLFCTCCLTHHTLLLTQCLFLVVLQTADLMEVCYDIIQDRFRYLVKNTKQQYLVVIA